MNLIHEELTEKLQNGNSFDDDDENFHIQQYEPNSECNDSLNMDATIQYMRLTETVDVLK